MAELDFALAGQASPGLASHQERLQQQTQTQPTPTFRLFANGRLPPHASLSTTRVHSHVSEAQSLTSTPLNLTLQRIQGFVSQAHMPSVFVDLGQALGARLEGRALGLSTLESIKAAYASPQACIKANWCRIPMAVVIAIGLLILFTCFCCWQQCMSCCCCAGSSKKKRRSAFDNEYSQSRSGLLPNSTSFGQSADLPAMPSYNLSELKKPTYAIIGDDGSVTTDDPSKRIDAEFPESPLKEKPGELFSNANSRYHDGTSNQSNAFNGSVPDLGLGGRYAPEVQNSSHSQYSAAARTSPERRPPGYDPSQDYPLSRPPTGGRLPTNHNGIQGPRPQRTGHEFSNAQQDPERRPRPAFNEGPFPLMGQPPSKIRQPSSPRNVYQPYPQTSPTSHTFDRALSSSPPKPAALTINNFSQRLPPRTEPFYSDPYRSDPYAVGDGNVVAATNPHASNPWDTDAQQFSSTVTPYPPSPQRQDPSYTTPYTRRY